MNVLIELMNEDSMDNLITCIKYKIDKIIYLGTRKVINTHSKSINDFINEYNLCNNEPTYIEIDDSDLLDTYSKLSTCIKDEQRRKNSIYVDVTGGEELALVSLGMAIKEYDIPIHYYDVINDEIVEFGDENKRLSKNVKKRDFKLNIHSYIRMYGGRVNDRLQKSVKETENPLFDNFIDKLKEVAGKYSQNWCSFSLSLSALAQGPRLNVTRAKLLNELNKHKKINENTFKEILHDLSSKGLIRKPSYIDGCVSFEFASDQIKEAILDGGMTLELCTYRYEKKHSDEAKIGVHIDWDGVIEVENPYDVLNEIDVISLKGNIIYFITCKAGSLNASKGPEALNEIDVNTDKFGGKYARKVIATVSKLSPCNIKRAQAMGIENRYLKNM